MSSERPDKQAADPIDNSSRALAVPRWAVTAAALIVLLPVLLMSSMMLAMGLVGPSVHGEMAASGPDLVPVLGVIPLLLVIGAAYSVYRLYRADTE